MTYLERLQQSKDSKDATKNSMAARNAHVQLSKDCLEAEERKLTAESRLEQLKGEFPINTFEILKAKYEAEAAQQNFFDLIDLSLELFPEQTSIIAETPAPAPVTRKSVSKKK